MSDWELVENEQKNSPSSSDWEVYNVPVSQRPQSQEGLGEAAMKAIPRVAEDVYRGAFNAIKSIPGYVEAAKTEVPGAFNTLFKNPNRARQQALAGTLELINNLSQTPKGLAEYASNRLNLLPKEAADYVKQSYPPNQQILIDQALGNPQLPGESLIRGTTRNALNLYGIGGLANALNPLKLTSKGIAKNVLKTAEQNKNRYNSLYENLWKESENKGFSDLSDIAPQIDIETLRKYSPKKKILGIEEFIKNPNLQNAHRAKSDLLGLQRDLEKNTTMRQAERKHYKAVLNSVADIQNNMFKDAAGNIDKNMLNRYNQIQQGYANEIVPYRNKAINKFKRNEISAKELVNALSHGEFKAKRGRYHPEIGIRNKLLPAAATIGGASILKTIYDNMMGNSSHE